MTPAPPEHDATASERPHTFSPKLRADQKEVENLYAQLPAYAEKGKRELDRLFASGTAQRDTGEIKGARECFIACYLLARELNYRTGEAEALTLAALCELDMGNLERGEELMEGCRKLHEELADADGQAEALCNLGLVYARRGDLEAARVAQEQSLRLARDQTLRLTALGHLGGSR